MVVAPIVLLHLGGCSFYLVDDTPPNHADLEHVPCTRHRVWSMLDGLAALGWTASSVTSFTVAASDDLDWAGDANGYLLAGVGLVAAGVHAASAVIGHQEVSECREAGDAAATRHARRVRGSNP